MPQIQMHPLTKWLLGALLAVILLLAPAFASFTYNVLAEDLAKTKERVQKVEEVVQEIKIQGKVNEVLQSEQLKVLQAIRQQLKPPSSSPPG